MQSRDHDAVEFVQRRPVGNRWAVIVGISKYKHKIGDLSYAHCDAEEFCALLQKPSGGGFDESRILKLIDQEATTEALYGALRAFLKNPEVDDLVVLYFACHGFSDPDRRNAVYFVTHDTNPAAIPATAVPMREVELALKDTLLTDRVIIIADTCHSAAIALPHSLRSVVPDAQILNKYLDEISTAKPGVALLTSATASESAKEGAEWGGGHGVFTHFLLEGLRGAADGYKGRRDGKITVGELFDYVRDNVQRATRDTQHPTIGSRPFDRGLTMAFTGGLQASEHHEVGTGLLRLAHLERDRAGFTAAARHFVEAIEMARAVGGEYPQAELGLARALLGIGAYGQARAHLEKLGANDGLRADSEWELGMAHARAARRQDAVAAFARFVACADDGPQCSLARAYAGARPPRRLAVLVGIDRYADRSSDFVGCRNDAERMSRLLGSVGFETVVLCGEAATRDAVLDPRLYEALQDDDQLVLFYSGSSHVSRTARETEELEPYLTFYDFAFRNDEGAPRGALSANEIFSALSTIRARTLVIIDSECSPTLSERVRRQPIFDIMFATGPRQNAYAIDVEGESVGQFTYALCESVKDVDLATLTYGEWFGRARRFMRAQANARAQSPLLLGDHRARLVSDGELLDAMSHTSHGPTIGISNGVLRRRYSMLCRSVASSNPSAHLRFAYDFLDRKQLDDAKKAFLATVDHGNEEGQLGLGIVQTLQDHADAADTLRRSIDAAPAADAPLVAALADAAAEMRRHGARRALLVAGFELPDASTPRSQQVDMIREVLNHKLRLNRDEIVVLQGEAATRAAVLGAVRDLMTTSSQVPVLLYYCGDLVAPNDALVLHDGTCGAPGFLALEELADACRTAEQWITILDGEYTTVPERAEDHGHGSRPAPVGSRDITAHAGMEAPAPSTVPRIGRTTLLPKGGQYFAQALTQAASVATWDLWLDCLGPVEIVGDRPSGSVLRDFSRFLAVLHRYRTAWLGDLRRLLERLIEDREKAATWPEGRADLARVLFALGDYPAAIREYRRVLGLLESAPPSAASEPLQRARRGLGRALLENGTDYTAAVSELNQVAKADPSDACAHYYLSCAIRMMVERETLEKASQALETYRDLGGPLGDLVDIVPD